jgi:hypothetical protein
VASATKNWVAKSEFEFEYWPSQWGCEDSRYDLRKSRESVEEEFEKKRECFKRWGGLCSADLRIDGGPKNDTTPHEDAEEEYKNMLADPGLQFRPSIPYTDFVVSQDHYCYSQLQST